jgi:pimeloyl-ACP methyl ester carboxylesterase
MKLIVFFHGALSTPISGSFICKSLEDDPELFVNCNFHYDLVQASADDIFINAIQHVNELIESVKPDEVILLGHSWGGIVAHEVAMELQRVNDLALAMNSGQYLPVSVVTLSSPYTGSSTASWLSMLKPFSRFLANVATSGMVMRSFQKKKIRVSTLAIITNSGGNTIMLGENDGVVTTKSQHGVCRMMYNKRQLRIIELKLNHFEVLLSDEVVDLIRRFI